MHTIIVKSVVSGFGMTTGESGSDPMRSLEDALAQVGIIRTTFKWDASQDKLLRTADERIRDAFGYMRSHDRAGALSMARIAVRILSQLERVEENKAAHVRDNAVAEKLRQAGSEFGATTGRPRRCGWLDLPALKYAVDVNGCDGLIMTKVDVLTGELMSKIQIGVGYEGSKSLPLNLSSVKVKYESFPAWPKFAPPANGRLPQELDSYCETISSRVGAPIVAVSMGPEREQLIWRKKIF
jgi:hypothetical protein